MPRDDRPEKSKKKKKTGGLSSGALIGILLGGGVLLVAVCGGLIALGFYFFKGPGNPLNKENTILGENMINTKSVSLKPNEMHHGKITLDKEGARHKIIVDVNSADPQTEIEIVVVTKVWGQEKMDVIAQTKGRGKRVTLDFVAPGFGETPYRVVNRGPGQADCKISNNGLKEY